MKQNRYTIQRKSGRSRPGRTKKTRVPPEETTAGHDEAGDRTAKRVFREPESGTPADRLSMAISREPWKEQKSQGRRTHCGVDQKNHLKGRKGV